ncbi:MAG: hypothetical protein KZQ99_01005 [Candidatus Thiodiazotropha sp. (ex Dulcina madagascariensis)]|nr:hypothetical protein [Candidatus Thiodiazotropha sp. (ex Dulcina madagascariensis)]
MDAFERLRHLDKSFAKLPGHFSDLFAELTAMVLLVSKLGSPNRSIDGRQGLSISGSGPYFSPCMFSLIVYSFPDK